MKWGKARTRLGILAGLTLLVGGVVGGPMRGAAIGGAAGALRDPLSLMGDRSPGARGKGALLQTKLAYAPTIKGDEGPRTGKARAPIIPAVTNDLVDRRVDIGQPLVVPSIVPLTDKYPLFEGYPPPDPGPPGSPGLRGPPLTSPGPPRPPSGPTGPGGPMVTPVPEPATWAFMIAGMGLVGAAMRRRQGKLLALSATE